MTSGKLDNELNLSLEATPLEREKSLDLDVGYEPMEQTWELIILHDGSLNLLEGPTQERWNDFFAKGVQLELLANHYAILKTPERLIEALVQDPAVLYVEKPNRMILQTITGKRVSCILPVQGSPGESFQGEGERLSLTGNQVLLGIIDSGIDSSLPIFRRPDGSSRIAAYWDQNLGEPKLNGNSVGVDLSGHGTAVAYIASSVALDADLVVVRLGTPVANSFPRTTELMRALDFCVNYGVREGKPMAINVSFGNNYGGHDGESLLETYVDQLGDLGRTTICVGTGNEGLGKNHNREQLESGEQKRILLGVGAYEPTFNLQIWKYYGDELEIRIKAPSGKVTPVLEAVPEARRYVLDQTQLLVYYGMPKPYSQYQQIYLDFLPEEYYVNYGQWEILVTGKRVRQGQVDLWLPSASILGTETGFLNPSPYTTLTIPSTASKVISVGAYNALTFSYAPFSGRGYTRFLQQIKPDLAAPGVNVRAIAPGGGEVVVSGTSFATPFVTGSAALLMEWGIVRGNDPYLYGEKVKAYLIKGAKELPGMDSPNPMTGWGALCVRDSLPV